MSREQELDLNGIYWDFSLNGKQVDFERKKFVDNIKVSRTVKGADTLTILINDPDMVFIEDDIYIKDTPISLDMWFHGGTKKSSFYGYISEVNPDFQESGPPQLELFCLDKTHLMQRVKNTHSWGKVRSIDVVKEIVNGYGFKLIYEQNYDYLQQDISQSDQTDIEFLERLAGDERELFVAKLIGDTFFYVRLGLLSDPSSNLYYRYDAYHNNIITFKPSIDKETKKVDERYADIDPVTLDVDNFYASEASVALQSQGYPVEVQTVTYGSVRYDDSKTKDKNTTDTDKTERYYRNIDYNTLRGEAQLKPTDETIGIEYFQTTEVRGLGKYLSGKYFVEGVDHTLDTDNGFSISATLIKTGFGETMKPITPVSDEVATENTSTDFAVGDSVRITNDSATYAHASDGVPVPAWVRKGTWRVAQLDNEGQCVLLGDGINSWVRMRDIEKA